jgi:hypothetical protein
MTGLPVRLYSNATREMEAIKGDIAAIRSFTGAVAISPQAGGSQEDARNSPLWGRISLLSQPGSLARFHPVY